MNGKEHVLNFTEAGKPWGCADQVCVPVYPPALLWQQNYQLTYVIKCYYWVYQEGRCGVLQHRLLAQLIST